NGSALYRAAISYGSPVLSFRQSGPCFKLINERAGWQEQVRNSLLARWAVKAWRSLPRAERDRPIAPPHRACLTIAPPRPWPRGVAGPRRAPQLQPPAARE